MLRGREVKLYVEQRKENFSKYDVKLKFKLGREIKKVKRGIFWIKRSKAGGKNKRAR